jgi:hypothetical protein
MNEMAGRWPGAWVSDDHARAEAEASREREALPVEVAPLAYRVALAVPRHHQDADDVAREDGIHEVTGSIPVSSTNSGSNLAR